MALEKIKIRTLIGIELNIEILILVILWIQDYKIAFWILLIVSLIGTIVKLQEVKNG
jgi:hypothetical protein